MARRAEDGELTQHVSALRDAYAAEHQTINIYQGAHLEGQANRKLRVYVSSTYPDLAECRAEISAALRELDVYEVSWPPGFHAPDELETRLKAARDCDIFIAVLAWTYGDPPLGKSTSITELEYEAACSSGAARLAFLHDEKAPWPVMHLDRGAAFNLIDSLRSRLRDCEACDTFSDATDLRAKVLTTVARIRLSTNSLNGQEAHAAPRTAAWASTAWRDYRLRLVTEYRGLDLDALTPPEREEHLAISLREVFVEPNVREDVPPPELPKELQEWIRNPELLATADLPEGVDREELERTQQLYRSRPAVAAFDVLGRTGSALTVFLGDPGAGKSTLARYVALTLAEERDDPRLTGLRGCQPVLIELRDYAAERTRYETFAGYLAHRAESDGLGVPRDALDHRLRGDSRVLIIFDGLDELFDQGERETVTRQIAGFAAAHPGVRIIVTSRIFGYRPRILRDAGFRHFAIQDLDSRQIDAFLATWYGLAQRDRTSVAERQKRLSAAIRESPSIRELAGNPLLLTILAIIGKHQELPRERWKVYDHAASVLVQHWDVNKHLRDSHVNAVDLREDDKKELLRRLAYRMQSGAQGAAGNHILHEELRAQIEEYLAVRFRYEPARACAIAEAIIGQFRERNFILARYGPGIYGFVHRALLEFFCAGEVVARFEKTRALSEAALVSEVFDVHWEDLTWSEVLRLIAGMVDVSVANRLILHLVENARPTRSTVLDRPPLDAVALAVQCLVEIRNLNAAAEASERSLEALMDALRMPERSFAELRERRFEEAVLPSVAAIGARWPGRERCLDWFRSRGAIGVRPGSRLAARLVAALFPDDDEVRAELAARTVADPLEDQRRACLLGLAAVWPDHPGTLEAVLAATRDPIHATRQAAIEALGEHWPNNRLTHERLQRALVDVSEGVRKAALSILVQHWPNDVDTFPAVRRALGDYHEALREAALEALGRRWPEHAETPTAVRRALRTDPHWRVRKTALETLMAGWASAPESAAAVLRANDDLDEDVRLAALEALATHWSEQPQTFTVVMRAVDDYDDKVRIAAIRQLIRRFVDFPQTHECLQRTARGADGEARFAAGLILARRAGRTDAEVDYLRAALLDCDADVRLAAVNVLVADWRGRPATRPAVTAAATDPDGRVRTAAIRAVAAHWIDHPDSDRLLINALQDPAVAPRHAAFEAVGQYRGNRSELQPIFEQATRDAHASIRRIAFEILLSTMIRPADRRATAVKAAHDRDPGVRRFGLNTLATAGDLPERHPTLFASALRDPDRSIRYEVYELEFPGRFNLECQYSDLVNAMLSPVAELREVALVQLAARFPQEEQAQAAISHAATDPDDEVRETALNLVRLLRADDSSTRVAVAHATHDPSPDVRRSALHSTALQWPTELITQDRLWLLATDEDAAIRKLGITLSILNAEGDPPASTIIEAAAADSDYATRMAGMHALADTAYGHPEPPPALLRLFKARSPSVRRNALRALATCWLGSATASRVICELIIDFDDDVRGRAVALLGDQRLGLPEAGEFAMAALWDSNVGVARTALAVTRAQSSRAHTRYPAQALTAMRHSNRAVRVEALESLLLRWPHSPECRTAVRLGLFDEVYAVRKIAHEAVCLIWPQADALEIARAALRHPFPGVRGYGIDIAARIGPQDQVVRGRLLRLLEDENAWVRKQAAEVLMATGQSTAEISELLHELVQDQDGQIRVLAYSALAEFGQGANEIDTSAARDPESSVRLIALQRAVMQAPDTPTTRAVLAAARTDPVPQVRALQRANCLVDQDRLRSLEELTEAVSSEPWTARCDALVELDARWPNAAPTLDLVVNATTDPRREVRSVALGIRARRQREDPAVLTEVLAATTSDDAYTREKAVEIAAEMWPDYTEVYCRLAELTADPNALVRRTAVWALSHTRPAVLAQDIQRLMRMLEDTDWFVQWTALRTVRYRISDAEPTVLRAADEGIWGGNSLAKPYRERAADAVDVDLPTLLLTHAGSVKTTEAAVAQYALLSRWANEPEVLPILRQVAADGPPAHRVLALNGLAANWPEDPATLGLLREAITAQNPTVRAAGIGAAGALGPEYLTLELLAAACMDPSTEVRLSARQRWAARSVRQPTGGLEDAAILRAGLDGPEPWLDQHLSLTLLALRYSELPETRELLKRYVGNESLLDDDRMWLEWLLETWLDKPTS